MLPAKKTVSSVMSGLMSNPAVKSRFNEILGKRSNKFVSALISLLNADQNLSQAFISDPMSVLQVALKAATFNMPIGNDLGFAYIIPFKSGGKPSAQFILGYKGVIQLAMRSQVYKNIGATDIREGELKSLDPLFGDYEIEWIKDPAERQSKPIIGYIAGLKTKYGFEKKLFMSKEEIVEYEAKNRRGQYQSPSWKNYFDAMAMKTVLRRLLGTYGLLSIDIDTDADTTREIINSDDFDSENIDIELNDPLPTEDNLPPEVNLPPDFDPETGEIK